ncbi:MAG: ATP-dependent 6-phosphofructokinase [Caldiserica bacterium]|jgi:6-phosphofructokinase 1|nr:ATP-dependent 6-phosphofructokinase [Caldisericota bacterium]MDH7561840.1 ATP-dependent 6-phosphofructokinase [Caldisericota bacterium]
MKVKRLGILTGGGDCPGLNPAIRAVVMRAFDFGYEVLGIKDGWAGLINGDFEPLNLEMVRDILSRGGTILGTSRTNPFKKDEDKNRALENFSRLGLDALIVIGGDDTLSVAGKFFREGLPIVGIPKTMDNDVPETDYCIGFDTAVSVAIDALERLKDTAWSHRRIMVLEVMGREAGWVALYTGLAGGADWILIPEVPVDLDEVALNLMEKRKRGRLWGTVVVSEAVELKGALKEEGTGEIDEFGHGRLGARGVGQVLSREIEKRTGIPSKHAVIGHIQRGGSPVLRDRYYPTRFGISAVDLVHKGGFGLMVALKGKEIKTVAMEKVVGRVKTVPPELYEVCKILFK